MMQRPIGGRWDNLPPTNNFKETEMSNEIANARKTMTKAFEEDPDFRDAYQANIAMYIWDRKREGKTFNKEQCNEVADGLVKLIFES